MAVSPFRALLAAHLQATWNRSRKELGAHGAYVLGFALVLLALTAVIPLLGGSLLGGWALGRRLDHPAVPLALGGLLSALVLLGGVAGGLTGGTRVLALEATRAFPVRPRTLFAAELLAGLGDPMPLLMSATLLGLLLGVGLAHPVLLPLALLLGAAHILAMLLVQFLVTTLAAALARRLRVGLVLLGLGLWLATLAPTLATGSGAPRKGDLEVLAALGRSLRSLAAWTPGGQACLGLQAGVQGAWLQALLHQVYPLAVVAALGWLGVRALAREAGPARAGAETSRRAARLWSFRSPVQGLGRLQLQSLLGSQLGRFAFLIPLIAVVLVKGPLGRLKGQEHWALPVGLAYLALAASQLQLNQFGLDGPGVKALLLLPVRGRDLLAGKALGLAVHQGLQVLLLVVGAAFLFPVSPGAVVGTLGLGACFFLVQTGAGHLLSVVFPRPIPRQSLKNNTMPFLVVMAGMGLTMACGTVFGGIYALLAWRWPALLGPGMVLLAGATFLAYRAWLLPAAGAFLEARRERLVEHLG